MKEKSLAADGKQVKTQQSVMAGVSSGTRPPGSNPAPLLPACAAWGNLPNFPMPQVL